MGLDFFHLFGEFCEIVLESGVAGTEIVVFLDELGEFAENLGETFVFDYFRDFHCSGGEFVDVVEKVYVDLLLFVFAKKLVGDFQLFFVFGVLVE